MTFDTPPDLKPGDEVDVVTEIRRHDIVCWERVSENKLIMRALSQEEAASYRGRKFQVDKGDEPGSLKYIEVERI
jgi:hypothetical protein